MNRGAERLEQWSKVVVAVSAAAAIVLEAYLAAREWGYLLRLTAGLFVGAFVLARLRPAVCWALVLPSLYLVPAIFLAAIGRDLFTYQVTWMAALFGAVLATTKPTRWAIPARWRLPLVFWALVVATTWPAVVARECDFRVSLLQEYRTANSGIGGPPPVVTVWILYVALTYLIGILWFDSLFYRFKAEDRERYGRTIAAPLAVGALTASLVAIYQGLIDITWMNAHQWPSIHRASGTLLDGDAFGALASFWSSAFVGLLGASGLAWMLFGITGAIASWGGFWASGSRMALLGGLIGLLFVLLHMTRVAWRLRNRMVLLGGAAAVLVTLVLVAGTRWSSQSPAKRTIDSLPSMSRTSLARFAREDLWDRGAPYGSTSVQMVLRSPAAGIGIGTYHEMLPDYAYILTGVRRNFDNAQSWYRHELAELGLAGSLGWLAWFVMFVALLFTTGGEGATYLSAGAVKGALTAIGVVSLVSMPTQNAAVSLTVWTFAFWYLTLIPASQGFERLQRSPVASKTWAWIILWLLVLGCVGATLYQGWRHLRPAYRAIEAEWNYAYGFYDVERSPDLQLYRWTKQSAVAVFAGQKPWLKLTFWVHHPDVSEDPVRVRIWRKDPDRNRLIIDTSLRDSGPVTQYVRVPEVGRHMMLETWVSRTWRPADRGLKDARDLGLGIAQWTFVYEPTDGAVIIR